MEPTTETGYIAKFIYNAIYPNLANRFQNDENNPMVFHNTSLRTPKDVVTRVKLQVLEFRLRLMLEDIRHKVTKVVISVTADGTSKVVERWVFTFGENILSEENVPIKPKLYRVKCNLLLEHLSKVIAKLPQLNGRFTTNFCFHSNSSACRGLDRQICNKRIVCLPQVTIGNTTVALHVEFRRTPLKVKQPNSDV